MITVFFARYVRTQRCFIARPRPWADFCVMSLVEWAIASLTGVYLAFRMSGVHPLEVFALVFVVGTLVRYILRKEFQQDSRGLGRDQPAGVG